MSYTIEVAFIIGLIFGINLGMMIEHLINERRQQNAEQKTKEMY
jgi:hypothetical protein